MIDDIPTPDIEPQSFVEANVRGDLDDLRDDLKDDNKQTDPCLIEPSNSYETLMWVSSMFFVPLEIRERHLNHYEAKDTVKTQASGTELRILFPGDDEPSILLTMQLDGWCAERQYNRSLNKSHGVNIQRWFDKLWSAEQPRQDGERKAVLLHVDVLDMHRDESMNGLLTSWEEDDER